MPTILCTVPSGRLPREQMRRVGSALRRTYRERIGGGSVVRVLWSEIPAGQMFTAGQPSETSVLLVEVPDQLEGARREAALFEFASVLEREANVPPERAMITLADRGVFVRFLAANSRRIRRRSRPLYWAKTALGAWRSHRRDGVLTLRTNL